MIRLHNASISLDRRERGSDIDFISHAHSDHIAAAKSSRNALASDATSELIEAAYKIKLSRTNHANFELLDSGHMLGAKQLYINDIGNGSSLVYTGDFQMRHGYACPKIKSKHADIAIVDSTYPYPDVLFEEHEVVREDMERKLGRALDKGIVLFTAFRMGKAQELIAIMNGMGIKPIVSRRVGEINKVYMKNGIMLDYASAYDDDASDFESLILHNFVGIVEARGINALALRLSGVHGKHVYTAIASGLAKEFKFDTDIQFPLSSHADFRQTVRYIDRVRPELVLTYGKDKNIMAQNLSAFGISAVPFTDEQGASLLNIAALNRNR